MIYTVIIALILIPSTKIVELPDTEIVRRGNFVIAATVDGFLCYGRKAPRSVRCHRAVQLTQFGECAMLLGRSHQAEDLPKEVDRSVTFVTSRYNQPPWEWSMNEIAIFRQQQMQTRLQEPAL